MLKQIATFLENTAKKQQVVYYSDLAAKFHMPPIHGWNSHPLRQIFDDLDQEDANLKRPFRTVVVWAKDSTRIGPGNGFYEALEKYRHVPNTPATREQVLKEELERAWEYPYWCLTSIPPSGFNPLSSRRLLRGNHEI
jgi:hypothetical protein